MNRTCSLRLPTAFKFRGTLSSRNEVAVIFVQKMYFIEEIISSSLTGTSDIMTLKTAKGLALEDILTEVHTYVHRSKFMFLFVT